METTIVYPELYDPNDSLRTCVTVAGDVLGAPGFPIIEMMIHSNGIATPVKLTKDDAIQLAANLLNAVKDQ